MSHSKLFVALEDNEYNIEGVQYFNQDKPVFFKGINVEEAGPLYRYSRYAVTLDGSRGRYLGTLYMTLDMLNTYPLPNDGVYVRDGYYYVRDGGPYVATYNPIDRFPHHYKGGTVIGSREYSVNEIGFAGSVNDGTKSVYKVNDFVRGTNEPTEDLTTLMKHNVPDDVTYLCYESGVSDEADFSKCIDSSIMKYGYNMLMYSIYDSSIINPILP